MVNTYKLMQHRNKILCNSIYLVIAFCARTTDGGTCWEKIADNTNLCQKAFRLNMTKEECCRINGPPTVSWSHHEITSDIFYWNFLSNGANKCQRCHTNCSSVQCEEGKTCRMLDGLPVCICRPLCDKTLKARGALCGTDGQKYRNYCALQRLNCLRERVVKVEYYGRCRNSCKKVHCEEGTHCLQDQNGVPHCISCHDHCNIVIPDNPGNYMCGENGKTYRNTCELRADICKTGRSIRISHFGKCLENETCRTLKCPHKTTCLVSALNDKPVCMNCPARCSHALNFTICGTDKRTYHSYCNMILSGCQSGIFLSTKHRGKCKGRIKSGQFRKIRFHNKNGVKIKDLSTKIRQRQHKRHTRRKRRRRNNKHNRYHKISNHSLKKQPV
ncbi:follistatin-like isoform X1 [Ruditapes philippinarum]|uniref:follistatin-like isoform X1 n=1 Tax=Ruditapes philippinarum TaxID=129788 RepID=UPI00295C0E20|nr:follistatin-like isoform X1 [Ruditapes philippinarum]